MARDSGQGELLPILRRIYRQYATVPARAECGEDWVSINPTETRRRRARVLWREWQEAMFANCYSQIVAIFAVSGAWILRK